MTTRPCIKAFLLVERNATRDYLDVAALSRRLGLKRSAEALRDMSKLYADFAGEGGDMLTSVLVKLAAPDPVDLEGVDLAEYKGIVAPGTTGRRGGRRAVRCACGGAQRSVMTRRAIRACISSCCCRCGRGQ